MKKILNALLITILLIIGLLVLTGCENKDNSTTTPAGNTENTKTTTETIDYKNMTANDLLSHIKDINNVTVDEYVWLISTYSNVEVKEDFTLESNITDEAIKQIKSDAKPKLNQYLEKLLNSDSKQVRGYGISLITSLIGVSKDNLELAKKLIKTEKDPYVLYKATRALSNEAKSDKEIADFLIKMASNDNAKIRAASANALGNTWSQGVNGAVDTIIKLMNDKDTDVRKAACRYSGKLGDESVIAPLVKILNNAADADIHGSCVEGLVTLWYDYPFFKNTSEKAYKATMDYLKKTPRTEKIPAWTAVGSFKTTSTQDSFKEWKKKATYFKEDEVYNVMVDIIKDGNANYLARTSAIDIIKAHCSEAKFKGLKSIIDGLKDSKATSVKSSYDNKAK